MKRGSPTYQQSARGVEGFQQGFDVQVATTASDIKALEPDWRALEMASPDGMALFQGFDWVWSWCKVWFHQQSTTKNTAVPCIVTVWRDGKLVSVWPLQIGTSTGVETLSWLSSPALQYGGPLIDPSCDINVVCQTAWKQLEALVNIDLFRFENVAETSLAFEFLKEKCETAGRSQASVLITGELGDWQAYQATLKATARRARRKRYNKLSRAGDMMFKVHEDTDNLTRLIERAIDWKRKWLEDKKQPGSMVQNPLFKTFLADLAGTPKSDTSSWVAGELSIDGKPVAIEIGAISNGHYYSYLGAYDSDLSKFSPGKIQMECMIGWALENGISKFDFLNVVSQYKTDWSDVTIAVEDFSYTRTMRGWLFHTLWLKHILPTAKLGWKQLGPEYQDILLSLFGNQISQEHDKSGS